MSDFELLGGRPRRDVTRQPLLPQGCEQRRTFLGTSAEVNAASYSRRNSFGLTLADKVAFSLREILPLFFLKKERIGEVEAMVAEQKCSLLSSLPLLARKAFHRDCIVELATAIETAETFTPSAALRHVVKHGLGNYFGEAMTLSVESAIGELQKFPTIAAFLEQVQSVKGQLAKIKELAAKAKDAVMLSTIHAAKGMEWQLVFLIGLLDGVLPSNCNGSDIDEEKRLLYVGITRAKQRLYLSYPRMSDNTVEFNKPCRFLAGHF